MQFLRQSKLHLHFDRQIIFQIEFHVCICALLISYLSNVASKMMNVVNQLIIIKRNPQCGRSLRKIYCTPSRAS
jgi:hypothetical protein